MAISFTASINKNVERMKQKVNEKIYSISIDLFTRVVSLTPSPAYPGKHAKGLLANQWYPKEGGFSSEVGATTNRGGLGSMYRIGCLRGGKEFYEKNGMLTLTNNLKYAYQAEMLGWAKTLPYRMVALSLQEIAAKYK